LQPTYIKRLSWLCTQYSFIYVWETIRGGVNTFWIAATCDRSALYCICMSRIMLSWMKIPYVLDSVIHLLCFILLYWYTKWTAITELVTIDSIQWYYPLVHQNAQYHFVFTVVSKYRIMCLFFDKFLSHLPQASGYSYESGKSY